jgi:[FeFe] hydrogenase H-cluster maturation GTPase HydF
VKGTTTDPVYKTMELLPIGPVVIIDTPGLDDEGELGELRIKKTYEVLAKTDIAVIVVDASVGVTREDMAIMKRINDYEIPFVVVFNKADLVIENRPTFKMGDVEDNQIEIVIVSSLTGEGIEHLKNVIGSFGKDEEKKLIADIVKPLDMVVLVVPIDESAPKGRIILPQQMVIREILDIGASAIVVKDTEYEECMKKIPRPDLVITDSQVFGEISARTPDNVPLTSFSIILARAKGNLSYVVKSVSTIDELVDGDTVLIAEGCTHHRQCNDIGTVKLPNLIRKRCGKDINFEFTSGREFPEDLNKYKMIIHCGGCMLNDKELKYRQKRAISEGIPMTNYGIAIAYMKGRLARSVDVFEL